MKRINLTVDNATLARAEKHASEQKTSVASLLRDYLKQLASTPVSRAAARRRLLRLSAVATGEVGARTWTRDDLYAR